MSAALAGSGITVPLTVPLLPVRKVKWLSQLAFEHSISLLVLMETTPPAFVRAEAKLSATTSSSV